MKKKTKFLLGSLLAASVMIFGSCNEKNNAQMNESSKKTKMTIMLRGGSYSDVIKADLPTFEKENNVEVEVLEMSFGDLHTGIALDAQNKKGTYDLVMVDGSWKQEFTENGVLRNLSELGYSFDDDIIPNTTEICKNNGQIYLAPYFGNVTVMMYNKKAVETAGYKPDEITSLDTLLDAAKKSHANGIDGFVYRGDTGDNIVSDFLPILLAEKGWVIDSQNNPTVNTKEFVKAIEYYKQLVSTGKAMSKDDIVAAVDSGKAAFAIGWPGWYVPSAESAADYKESPVCAEKNGEALDTSEYGTWTIGIPQNSPNPELGLKLLKFIMDPEIQLGSVKNGGVPCRYSVLKNSEVLKDYPQFATVCAALENGVYRPAITEWAEFTNILGAEIGAILSGAKTTEEGLATAQKNLESLMKK